MTELLHACALAAILTTQLTSTALYLIRWITRPTFAATWALAAAANAIRTLAQDRPGWAAVSTAAALLMAWDWRTQRTTKAKERVG